jgi:hypothetical protein
MTDLLAPLFQACNEGRSSLQPGWNLTVVVGCWSAAPEGFGGRGLAGRRVGDALDVLGWVAENWGL